MFLASTDLDLCKKILSSPLWPNRLYDNHYINTCNFGKPLGLLTGNGEHFKHARALTVKLLHQQGFFNRAKMENYVAFEMAELESKLSRCIEDSYGEITFCPHHMLEVSTLNVVWRILVGKRFERDDDPVLHEMLCLMNEANKNFTVLYTVLEVIPGLKYFPKLTSLVYIQSFCNYFYRVLRVSSSL